MKLNTKEFDNLTIQEVKTYMKSYYLEHIEGKQIVNKDKGITIKFNANGRNKTLNWLTKREAVVLKNIVYLLKTAKFSNVKTPKPKHEKQGVLFFMNFQIKCIVDNQKTNFHVAVKITKQGSFQYDLYENYIKKDAP